MGFLFGAAKFVVSAKFIAGAAVGAFVPKVKAFFTWAYGKASGEAKQL